MAEATQSHLVELSMGDKHSLSFDPWHSNDKAKAASAIANILNQLKEQDFFVPLPFAFPLPFCHSRVFVNQQCALAKLLAVCCQKQQMLK